MGLVIVGGVGLCFMTGGLALGAGMLIGAGISAGIGVASGHFNPRMVALNGLLGTITAGVGSAVSGASIATKIITGAGVGAGHSLANQAALSIPISWRSVGIGAGLGSLGAGIAGKFSLAEEIALSPRTATPRFVVSTSGDVLDTSAITIPEGKLTYLLDNPTKAGAFRDSLGFDRESLEPALRQHLVDNFGEATPSVPMVGGGSKFQVVGSLGGPTGAKWAITTVWGINGPGTTRLITATP
jgi:hypothetical protein